MEGVLEAERWSTCFNPGASLMGEACDQLPISSCLTGVLAHTEDRWVRGEESSGWGGWRLRAQ